ncbi:MAG TPA: hypothetical protein VFK41_04380 [Nocardioidaceae bacterium]|nr:hypothetical protein [Nocardioidaceae bacterium]
MLYAGVVGGCLLGWLAWMLTSIPGLVLGMAIPFVASAWVALPQIRRRSQGRRERHT